MMDFDSYVQKRTEDALKTEHYDPLGNSGLATYNKTFIQGSSYSVKCLYRELKAVAKQPALDATLGDVLGLIIVTALFPVFALLRTCCGKSRAKSELKAEWRR